MKKFITTTIKGYISLLFPLMISLILLEKLHKILQPINQQLIENLHIAHFYGILLFIVISIVDLILLGFLCGWLIKSKWVQTALRKYESTVLEKIPLYNMAKSLLGIEGNTTKGKSNFRPALLLEEQNMFTLCYVTSEGPDFYMLFLSEGGLTGGELRVVPKQLVHLLDMHLTDFSRLIKQSGVDAEKYAGLFQKAMQSCQK